MTERPVLISWLASYPKSGNTFVRLLVDAAIEGQLNINDLHHSTAVSFSGPWHTLPTEKFSFLEQAMFQPTALMAQIEYFPKLLTKTHNANFVYKGWALIPAALTSRVILVVRDPRDVAISQAAHFGVSIDESIAAMADENRLSGSEKPGARIYFLSSWTNFIRSFLLTDIFSPLVVKYENLLTEPEDELKKILSFLEVSVTEKRIRAAVELASFAEAQRQEEANGFRERVASQERFFLRGKAGYWRDVLTPEQAARIVEDHKDAMAKLGYPLV